MKGRINSFQSMGAVDGPGVRCVVFLQGCPLRCPYCHNPETWDPSGGEEIEVETLVAKILRYRSFITRGGGVTLSGGEPLMQPDFCASLLRRLKEEGIHTALDTSGICNLKEAKKVLPYVDLVLCDIKFHTDKDYKEACGGSLTKVKAFLSLVKEQEIPLWFRHVVVPGITDSEEEIKDLSSLGKEYPTLEKIELLPFHKMCTSKYEEMGIPFPLIDVPACTKEHAQSLQSLLFK